MDPPKHGRYRAMIFPLFTPKAVRALEAKVSDYASQYINQFKDKGGCEFMSEFAFEFPIKVVLDLIGLPQDMVGQFLEWETDLLHGHDLETIAAATKNVVAYLRAEIDERKRKPREDLLTFGVNAEVDGVKMTDDEVLGFAFNLFIGWIPFPQTSACSSGISQHIMKIRPSSERILRLSPMQLKKCCGPMPLCPLFVPSRKRLR
jgi:cytochrome P450